VRGRSVGKLLLVLASTVILVCEPRLTVREREGLQCHFHVTFKYPDADLTENTAACTCQSVR
jgi:hypothetical protein